MGKLSKKRQETLKQDINIVRILYEAACKQFGAEKVHKDLTTLWDVRCMWGMKRILPFGHTEVTSLGELLFIAKELLGYKEVKYISKARQKVLEQNIDI